MVAIIGTLTHLHQMLVERMSVTSSLASLNVNFQVQTYNQRLLTDFAVTLKQLQEKSCKKISYVNGSHLVTYDLRTRNGRLCWTVLKVNCLHFCKMRI